MGIYQPIFLYITVVNFLLRYNFLYMNFDFKTGTIKWCWDQHHMIWYYWGHTHRKVRVIVAKTTLTWGSSTAWLSGEGSFSDNDSHFSEGGDNVLKDLYGLPHTYKEIPYKIILLSWTDKGLLAQTTSHLGMYQHRDTCTCTIICQRWSQNLNVYHSQIHKDGVIHPIIKLNTVPCPHLVANKGGWG